MANKETIASANEPILVTGAAGFIGPHVVGNLLNRGFLHIRCLARPSANLDRLAETIDFYQGKERVESGY